MLVDEHMAGRKEEGCLMARRSGCSQLSAYRQDRTASSGLAGVERRSGSRQSLLVQTSEASREESFLRGPGH